MWKAARALGHFPAPGGHRQQTVAGMAPPREAIPALAPGLTEERAARLLHFLTNLALAYIWSLYAWSGFTLWRRTGSPLHLVLLARNGAVCLLFLCRRAPRSVSRDARGWLVALAGTLVGFLYGEGDRLFPLLGTPLMILGGLLSTVSLLALGRSFGVVPANRGVKTRGPYALVRHPIYFSYFLLDVGFFLQAASLRNGLVFLSMMLATYLRAQYEERFLRRDPRYRDYADRTRYMFVPGIL
jgi:protein-S-isoprenylcysteine O-methyltransferase Ste14